MGVDGVVPVAVEVVWVEGRPNGSIPAAISHSALITVLRLITDAVAVTSTAADCIARPHLAWNLTGGVSLADGGVTGGVTLHQRFRTSTHLSRRFPW